LGIAEGYCRRLEAAKGTVLAALPLELLRFLEILAPELAALECLVDASQVAPRPCTSPCCAM
jgi:hypothetical protein